MSEYAVTVEFSLEHAKPLRTHPRPCRTDPTRVPECGGC